MHVDLRPHVLADVRDDAEGRAVACAARERRVLEILRAEAEDHTAARVARQRGPVREHAPPESQCMVAEAGDEAVALGGEVGLDEVHRR